MRARCTARGIVALLSCLAPVIAVQASPHPYVPPSVRAAEYTAWQRHSAFVPVADGTRLAITWYTPAKGPPALRFPVLLWYMPGHRESVDPRSGEVRPGMDLAELEFFTARGYAVAVAEMRGSGASFGYRVIDRGPQIGRDGRDVVDWIARQPWSDGRVGMIGASFQGFSQFATAAERPRALKAIFPEIAGFDDYTSLYYPGGILNLAIGRVAYAAMGQDDRNEFDPQGRPPRWPSLPVIDEDGDGELADEIPQYGGARSFLDGPPRYADGAARQGLFHRATMEHGANGILTADRIRQAPFRDSPLDASGIRYRDLGPGLRADRIAAARIAVYNRGGWMDYHARDTTQWFATLAGHTPVRLLMAPTAHAALPRRPQDNAYLRHFGDEQTRNDLVLAEKLRFFDRYVRGIRNGFEREPPVLLYVMGEGWRREDEWPLRRARTLTLSLDANGTLSEGRGTVGVDSWRVDPLASSLSQGANRWNYGIAAAGQPMSLDASRSRRREYTTPPLGRAHEITGHPVLRLQLGADVPTVDVYAYLEDVAPDGTSLLVSEGQLKADYHRITSGQRIVDPLARLRVRPTLPYHGYERADRDESPLAKGRTVRLEFDLMPVAWRFAAGHRIRLSLAGADDATFETVPEANATWRIHRGPGTSVLELPFIR